MNRQARLLILLPDETLADIDLYRRNAPDLPGRTEAIRRLIADGLTLHTQGDDTVAKPDRQLVRQTDQVRDERMILRDELEQMRPKTWKQDSAMNEVPVFTRSQLARREAIGRRMEQLNEADRALLRL